MKIRIGFKTPDAVHYAAEEAVNEASAVLDKYEAKEKIEDIKDQLSKWVRYGESVTIEFDLETNTARVVPVR
jgi:hypothetical protein